MTPLNLVLYKYGRTYLHSDLEILAPIGKVYCFDFC
eukprot:SAG31_NODE_11461_length_1027_cov_1.564655_1_plen_35_part_10